MNNPPVQNHPDMQWDMAWQTIDTAPKDGKLGLIQMILAHSERKWIRFGRFYPEIGRWYYSGTNERSQWAQVEGDSPTHWMPLPPPPQQDSKE